MYKCTLMAGVRVIVGWFSSQNAENNAQYANNSSQYTCTVSVRPYTRYYRAGYKMGTTDRDICDTQGYL